MSPDQAQMVRCELCGDWIVTGTWLDHLGWCDGSLPSNDPDACSSCGSALIHEPMDDEPEPFCPNCDGRKEA